MDKDIVIKVSDLTKCYGEIIAVDHINFEVEKGEIFGFLGPNGAGKTTTIRMLTGLSKPTDGKASIFGLDINSQIVQIKKHIGVVPEISNLYDELTAFDNLLFIAQLYGVPSRERNKKAEELLKTFRLYEAFFEGIFLFVILWYLRKRRYFDGFLFSLYLIGYGMIRFFIEFFREPDPQLSFIIGPFNMGQVLCFVMVFAGLIIFVLREREKKDGN